MNLFLFIGLICGTALLPLLYLFAKVVQGVFSFRRQEPRRVEKRARIRRVQIMNEKGRRVPFVKLKVEICSGGEEGMIADAEGFYPYDEAARLGPGTVIWVRQRPDNAMQLQVIKRPAWPKNMKISEDGYEASQRVYNATKKRPGKSKSRKESVLFQQG